MLRMQSGGNNLPTAYEYYRIRASVHVGVARKGCPSINISRTQPSLRACYAARVETVVYLIRASVHVGLACKGSPSSTTSHVADALATVNCPSRPAARASYIIVRAAEKRGKLRSNASC